MSPKSIRFLVALPIPLIAAPVLAQSGGGDAENDAIMYVAGESSWTYVHSGFRCVRSTCGAGTPMRNPATLGYGGCSNTSGTVCMGVCTICTGTVVATTACRPFKGDTCIVSSESL
jgi:hypothetical protein